MGHLMALNPLPRFGHRCLQSRYSSWSFRPFSWPSEYEDTQKKQSFAAPTMGRDLFLHQTFVPRAPF